MPLPDHVVHAAASAYLEGIKSKGYDHAPAYSPGGFFAKPAPTLGPAEVLGAVEAMDAAQRGRLAELLGFGDLHPFLYLPDRSGGFALPVGSEI